MQLLDPLVISHPSIPFYLNHFIQVPFPCLNLLPPLGNDFLQSNSNARYAVNKLGPLSSPAAKLSKGHMWFSGSHINTNLQEVESA